MTTVWGSDPKVQQNTTTPMKPLEVRLCPKCVGQVEESKPSLFGTLTRVQKSEAMSLDALYPLEVQSK